jgi:uncharacterized Tic20 family protein
VLVIAHEQNASAVERAATRNATIYVAITGLVLALAGCATATIVAQKAPEASGLLRLVWMLCSVTIVLAGQLRMSFGAGAAR